MSLSLSRRDMSFLYSHNGGDLRVSLTSDLCWRELERRTYAGIETIWCDELVEGGVYVWADSTMPSRQSRDNHGKI